MPVSVTMPRLGESVSEGTVTRWLKQEGERVEADEPLLEVSTDKVDTEIPAPARGILTSIKVGEDETVDVGVELAVISESAEAGGSEAPPGSAGAGGCARAAPVAAAAETPAAQAEPRSGDGGSAGRSSGSGHSPTGRPSAGTGRRGCRACAQFQRRRWRRRPLRHPAGPPARRRARRRPDGSARHRCRWPHPQAGRARRSPQRLEPGSSGGDATAPAPVNDRPAPRRSGAREGEPARSRRSASRRYADAPRRCRGCVRSSRPGWSRACRSALS